MVLPEPLIPENKITKGCFTSREFLISLRKFGGLIKTDSIEFFSSLERSTSFRTLPISFSARDSFIDSTAPYATLLCKRIISSSSKSSLNFSSVSLFLNFIKNSFSVGVSVIFSKDCSSSFFVCFSIFALDFFGTLTDLFSLLVGADPTLTNLFSLLVGADPAFATTFFLFFLLFWISSLLLLTQFFSFSFSDLNMR